MKRTWARFEAVMKQGSEGEMAALPPGNPEGEKRGPGAVKRSTKLCSGESQSEKHDEARDSPRMRGKLALPIGMSLQPWITPAHAGKTHIHQDKIRGLWDHPRTCGENGGSASEEKEQEKRSVLAGYQPQHTRSVLS